MGERNPTFPNVQFLDSSESDEKSARLSGEGRQWCRKWYGRYGAAIPI